MQIVLRILKRSLPLLLLAGTLPAAEASPIPFSPEVWVMSSDGTDQRNLGESVYGPGSWAPDSRRLAVEGLKIIDTETGEATSLAEGWAPDWSPDGTEIVFTRYTEGLGQELYAIDPEGKNERRLTTTEGADQQPVWSPDGSKVAWLLPGGQGWASVMVVDRDGTDARAVTSTMAAFDRLAWSPDSTRLAFIGADHQLHVADVEGQSEVTIGAHMYTNHPVWCPDGSLFYGSDGSEEGRLVNKAQGTESVPVTEGRPEDCSTTNRLAFLRDGDIHIIDPGEAGTPNLTDSSDRSDFNPHWSPDGEHLAFTSQREYPPPVEVQRELRVSAQRHLVLKASFDTQECFGTLKAQRLTDRGWKTVKSKRLSPGFTEIKVKVRDQPGYYRLVASDDYSEYGEWHCTRTLSNIIRHRH
jgi:Tol biopolymer transport system component